MKKVFLSFTCALTFAAPLPPAVESDIQALVASNPHQMSIEE